MPTAELLDNEKIQARNFHSYFFWGRYFLLFEEVERLATLIPSQKEEEAYNGSANMLFSNLYT